MIDRVDVAECGGIERVEYLSKISLVFGYSRIQLDKCDFFTFPQDNQPSYN